MIFQQISVTMICIIYTLCSWQLVLQFKLKILKHNFTYKQYNIGLRSSAKCQIQPHTTIDMGVYSDAPAGIDMYLMTLWINFTM